MAKQDVRLEELAKESERASSNRARTLKEEKLGKVRLKRQLLEGVDTLKQLKVKLRPKEKYDVQLMMKKQKQARKDMAELKKIAGRQEHMVNTATHCRDELKYNIGRFVEHYLTGKRAPVRIKVVQGSKFTDIYITGGPNRKTGAKKQFLAACKLLEKWHVDYGIPRNPPNPEKFIAISVEGLPGDDGDFDSVRRFKMLSVALVRDLSQVIRMQVGAGAEFSVLGTPINWRRSGEKLKLRTCREDEYLSRFDPATFAIAVMVNPVVG